ncbi:ABC transporter ATP-binding protein [Arachnia propionica]|uniref:ABC transporter ATP-binding protein n=1 Tax=Arachnia propionica TaxID=1750 RepID=A0A3P1WQG3_9ACTN|nr:ABC transporter ATP-binding protein [Arachnia propionica]RRD48842.1 ABC transporter ATP-binding protein [Arachnia propionica]
MPAIETHQLTKRYGSFTALDRLDLQVETGQVFGFLGPNGAGKSTTIRILLDEIRATSGSATLLGLDSHRDAVAVHRRLGYLPSDLALQPSLTGHQTLAFLARLRGGSDRALVAQLQERLDADLDKRVEELSSGNRQKVGLIACLMHRPELVIMDEPNAGLDPLVQHEFQQLIREIADDGRTVFLSSHTLSEVQRVADRVAIIRRGRLIATENVADLRSLRQVELILDRTPDPADLQVPGSHDVVVTDRRATLTFDGDLGPLLAAVGAKHRIVDVTASDSDLEDVFLTFYRERS